MTNARRIGVATRLSLVVVMALAAALSVGLVPAPPADAQVSSLPIQFSDVSIFATNSVRIDNGARVMSGHVVVNNASPGGMLVPGFELGLNNNARTPAGYAAVADSLKLSNGAVVSGNAFFNNLSNSGTISGTQNTPLALPVFTPLPTFKSAPPGTVDVTVASGAVQTIAAGNYRDITVMNNATLRIDQGVTNVRSITVSTGGKLHFLNLASGRTEVRVAEQLTIGNGFFVGPVDSDPLQAGKIIFYVASPSTTTVAVDTGTGGTLLANVYAPNGTLILDNNTNAVGAFLAKNIDVQNGSTVGLESFFTQQAPAITSANATTFTVGQAGSFTVTTTGFPTPSITKSGALPSGVTFTDNGNGTGTLSGTPAAGTGGTYAITFTASNGVSPDAVQNFTLTVNQVPAITSANATTFTVGQAGSFTVTTSGFPAASITRGGAALPSGVTFTDLGNGTGTLSGTPAAGTGGTYAITFTATNTAGSSPTQNFTLTVNQAPVITSANSTTFIVGQAGSFTVTTTGFPTPSVTQGGALPAGVTFTSNPNGTGTLSGTPAAGTAGNYSLTFTATNAAGSQVQNFTLTVAQAPTITSANATTFTLGQLGSFTVTTTGFPPASIAQGGTLPGGVTFISNGDGTGTLSGTPAAGTGGTYPLTFTATNVAGSSPTQNFTLTVNQAPVITSANSTTFIIGQPGSFTVTTTGFPTPSIAQGGALPSGVTFTPNPNGTGTLSGTPAAGTGGSYPLTFTASNGVPPNAVQNFTLGVSAPPSAVNDGPYLTDANTTFSRATSDVDDLLDNDSLGFPVATLTSFGGGSLGGTVTSNAAGATANFGTGGSLVVQSNGAFTFTPSTGFTGVFTFQYRLTNTAGTSDATVTIQVRPKAVADLFNQNVVGNVNINAAFSVVGNDVFNGPVTASLVSPFSANGGDVTLDGSGLAFTYNPPVGFQGNDTFTYTITDASGFTSAPATVTVPVSGMIWFVNNNSGACSSLCNGRLTNPFTTLDSFTSVNDGVGTHPANNQNTFVYESAATYTFSTGTLLRAGQKLIGQDATATLATIAGVTVPSGSALPAMNTGGNATTIGSTVTLAASSTVRGLTISTGASTGMSGGAVSGVAVSETAVATSTGTAVSLSGTGGVLSFRSVSANGAVNGISLTNTTGSVTVTGDGNTSVGGNGSGGTIQNTSGHGIALNNAQSVSLTNLNIQSVAGSGIDGTLVTNFAFNNGTINNATAGSNISFASSLTQANLSGTVAVANNVLTNARVHGVDIVNFAGTLGDVNISGNTLTSSTSAASSLGSAVRLLASGNATTVANVTKAALANNTITNFPSGAGFVIQGGNGQDTASAPAGTVGVPGSATDVIAVTGNLMNGGSGGLGNQADRFLTAAVNGRGQGNFNVSSNGTLVSPITNIDGVVIEVSAFGNTTVTSTISNNVVSANNGVGSAGIGVGCTSDGLLTTPDNASLTTTISGNTVTLTNGPGILAVANNSLCTMTARIINNTVAAPATTNAARAGIRVDSGTSAGDTAVCLEITGNITAGSTNTSTGTTSPGINLRKQGTNATVNDFGIEGLSPSPTGSPNVENHVNSLNTSTSGTFGVGGTALLSATSGFTSCVAP
jgi:hypothetical protein